MNIEVIVERRLEISVLRAINLWAQHDLLDNEHVIGVTEAALKTKPQEKK